VIHEFSKNSFLCIIKKAASPFLYDHLPKTSCFGPPPKTPLSEAIPPPMRVEFAMNLWSSTQKSGSDANLFLRPEFHVKPHGLGAIFGAKDQKNAPPWRVAST
jgi:hypothetical protein